MPIITSDLELRLSGGASNTNPNASLGGAMSTVLGGVITTAQLNNLFDDVSGDESDAGDVEYRCVYVRNNHGSLTWQQVKLWLTNATPSSGITIAYALAGEGLNGTAETIADESTAPSGETFTSPESKAAGLSLGDLAAGDVYPFWIRRTVAAGASAANSTGPEHNLEGETGA